MDSIKTLHKKPPRAFMMSSRVRHADVVVGTAVVATKAVTGIFAISNSDKHILFAEANGAGQEALILAAEIVHSYMYFITDEAMQVALSIAKGSDETDEAALLQTAKQYLAQGMTVTKVRDLVTKAREAEKRKAAFQALNETMRTQKLIQVGRHLRQMSNQPQLAAA